MNDDLDALLKELDSEIDDPAPALSIPDANDAQEIIIDNPAQIIQQEQDAPIDVKKYHKKLDDITDDVIDACKKDRAEIQEVVNLMFEEIRQARDSGHVPARGYLDSMTKLLEVKANVNMLSVKIMEVNAKMLAATKAGSMTINTNVAVAQGDDYLKKILEEPFIDGEA